MKIYQVTQNCIWQVAIKCHIFSPILESPLDLPHTLNELCSNTSFAISVSIHDLIEIVPVLYFTVQTHLNNFLYLLRVKYLTNGSWWWIYRLHNYQITPDYTLDFFVIDCIVIIYVLCRCHSLCVEWNSTNCTLLTGNKYMLKQSITITQWNYRSPARWCAIKWYITKDFVTKYQYTTSLLSYFAEWRSHSLLIVRIIFIIIPAYRTWYHTRFQNTNSLYLIYQ